MHDFSSCYNDGMRVWREKLCFLGVVGVTALLLSALPDGIVLPAFCRVPAEIVTAGFGVELERETLMYTVRGQAFVVSRGCAALGFAAMLFGVLVTRAPKWCWLAYPLTLLINAIRILATTLLALVFAGFRYERLLHMAVGASFFITTLVLLWVLTERNSYEN